MDFLSLKGGWPHSSVAHAILPIALYGCEIWGFENSQIIENLHNDFLRQIINLRKNVPLYIYMLHAELGRHLIQINIKSRMISFWLSIVNGKESKLLKLLYSIMFKEHEKGSYKFKWIRCINDILVAVPDLFKTEPANNPYSVKMDISRTLSDWYIQDWNEKANISSKGKQDLLFKDNLKFEKYLINVSKFYYSKIIKYRTGNHRLPVETGRWDDIPLNEQTTLVMSIIICLLVTF